jgi:hypothetical protein
MLHTAADWLETPPFEGFEWLPRVDFAKSSRRLARFPLEISPKGLGVVESFPDA